MDDHADWAQANKVATPPNHCRLNHWGSFVCVHELSYPIFCYISIRYAIFKTLSQGLPGYGWTLKKLSRWVENKLERQVSRTTLRTILTRAGLSWKKCKKLLTKADPVKSAHFVEQFQMLFEKMCREEVRIVYLDEAHLHQDLDLGYGRFPIAKPAWQASTSPSLSARLNWYGAYDFTEGSCFIWAKGACNSDHSVEFLNQVVEWLNEKERQIIVIWDGAPWHRSKKAHRAAQKAGIKIIRLPGYSPDLNPIEGLWKWMREDVSQHHGYDSSYELFSACKAFITRINLNPQQIIARLWPKFDLDPAFEKLLVSN